MLLIIYIPTHTSISYITRTIHPHPLRPLRPRHHVLHLPLPSPHERGHPPHVLLRHLNHRLVVRLQLLALGAQLGGRARGGKVEGELLLHKYHSNRLIKV